MIHGNSITLICVIDDYRNNGYGSRMLKESEEYIKAKLPSADTIILGRGKHYLLQGVPVEGCKAVSYFEKRGYSAKWTSVNMSLSLNHFHPDTIAIPPKPETVEFRLAVLSDMNGLLEAVSDAEPSWRGVFDSCIDPVMLSVQKGKIIGFQILSPNGGRFSPQNGKVGCIGCVGVIHEAREKGVGRQMVVEGINLLKKEGCISIELRYVELVDWYKKVGFHITGSQWMGEKSIVC